MYLQISLSLWKLQEFRDKLLFVREIAKKWYLYVISFAKHEQDTATDAYLKPSQISMMELFDRQQLTNFGHKLFLLSFTSIKVSS